MPAAAEVAVGADRDVRTVGAVCREWAKKFRARGIDSAELDARILVGCVLGIDRAALASADGRQLGRDEEAAIALLAERRLAHEPVARIVGRKEFWSLQLLVDASTLVPRPETETVVEATLAAIDAAGPRTRTFSIADLGTGSGAILLALLSELPNAWGVGTDVSFAALLAARENARRLGLDRAQFLACDMVAALRGSFDVIVSNPPYVGSHEIAALAPEVRDFDPRRALDGGADGLDFYRSIAAAAPARLASGGILIVELGAGQSQAVAALFAARGLVVLPPRPDLSGIPRALVVKTA